MKRMENEWWPQSLLNYVRLNRRRKDRPRITWLLGIQQAMTSRCLNGDGWETRGIWIMGCGKRYTNSVNNKKKKIQVRFLVV